MNKHTEKFLKQVEALGYNVKVADTRRANSFGIVHISVKTKPRARYMPKLNQWVVYSGSFHQPYGVAYTLEQAYKYYQQATKHCSYF